MNANSHDHDHSHGHSHDHGHHHHNRDNVQSLRLVFGLTAVFMVVEAVGGFVTNSLALLGDAVHMLTDIAALALSLFAFWMSTRPATDRKTYGYLRFEILAAFVNGVFLIILSLTIMWHAYQRLLAPETVKAPEMIAIATIGLIVNIFGAWILMKGNQHNLNMRAALFHVIGDGLGSVGAIGAGFLIYFFGWNRSDPVISFVIAGIIIVSAFKIILDTTHVILEGVPHHIDTNEIIKILKMLDHVVEVHDLHVWSIISGIVSLSVHIVAAESDDCFHHALLLSARKTLLEKFHIEHVTIQIEDRSLRDHEPTI